MKDEILHIVGATGLVGRALLRRAAADGRRVVAYSRADPCPENSPTVEWHRTGEPVDGAGNGGDDWVILMPIRALPDHLPLIEAARPRRVVVVSSTSRFSKTQSSDVHERDVAQGIVESEARLQAWAESRGIEWVVLRPTLIYGNGDDKNICEIARLISRVGFFPLIGGAHGQRQPVHADDVADACIAALDSDAARNSEYTISGAEVLSYRAMVGRVFDALSRPKRMIVCPVWAFRLALMALRLMPRYRLWSIAMVERMNQDMVYSHDDAARDLGFSPRPFVVRPEDLPR